MQHVLNGLAQHARLQAQAYLIIDAVGFVGEFILDGDAVALFIDPYGVLHVYLLIVLFSGAQEHEDFICYVNLCDTDSVVQFHGKVLIHLVCEMHVLEDGASVGRRIQFYRGKRDMSGNMLAEFCKMSRYAVMDYENDVTEPSLEDLGKMATVLGVEADKLYDEYYVFLAYLYFVKIKQIRLEHHLLQRELGAMLGVQRKAVERWEHGRHKVSRETWERLGELGLL